MAVDLTVTSDRKWLVFIFEQVLFNSLKYTETGGINVFTKDNALVIQDSGIGIRKWRLPRVFEKDGTQMVAFSNERAGLYMSQQAAEKSVLPFSDWFWSGTGNHRHTSFSPTTNNANFQHCKFWAFYCKSLFLPVSLF